MHIPIKFGNNNKFSRSPCTVLAGDIGATKTNLALIQFEGKNFTILKEDRHPTKDFVDACQMITEFLAGTKDPDLMCFGAAGPVQNGKATLTNLPWQIDSNKISAHNNNLPCE